MVGLPQPARRDRLAVPAALWRTFRAMALWVDALCIHEWCLFTEAATRRTTAPAVRDDIYRLLTAEPGARRLLTWERNRIRVLLEGAAFTCPWTERTIAGDTPFNPHLAATYHRYVGARPRPRPARGRPAPLPHAALGPERYQLAVGDAAAGFIEQLAAARNLPRFD